MSEYRPPVIIIGMHRSGTSLLARILHQCGVFMGATRNKHEEAYFFYRRNRRVFRLAKATWDFADPVCSLLDCPDSRLQVVTSLQSAARSIPAATYLGIRGYLKYGGLLHIDRPWGWKDPRNSYLLPIWLDIFPESKVIHISRNGVDVAESLRRREQKRRLRLYHPFFSDRCMSLHGGFDLWAEYVNMGFTVTRDIPPNRLLHVRYEDFVTSPKKYLSQLAQFLGTSFDPVKMEHAIRQIHPESAYAFLNNEELAAFYDEKRLHPLMRQLAYDGVPLVEVPS